MAKATRQMQHKGEHYVAKMNFRSEKILQSQIERLNKEKLLQVKSLNAQMRTYERKLQKINDRAAEVEKLSRNMDPSQRLPTREHFSKLSNDVQRQRHLATGVGYSYIDQLLGVSKPLVNRPLRWGINPSLPSLQQQNQSKPITLVTDAASSSDAFMTEIKGHPIYLRPREAVYIKRQRPVPGALVLPPIALKTSDREAIQQELVPHTESNTMPRDSLPEKSKVTPVLSNQDVNSQLSPILESEVEQAPEMSKAENKMATNTTKEIVKNEHIEGKPNEAEPTNIVDKPNIVIESNEPSRLGKEMFRSASTSSSSLRGHFITEYDFPSHGDPAKRFTRSNEMLNVETDQSQTDKVHNENEPNSFRYELHGRRFSL